MLRMALAQAVSDGIIPCNAADSVKPPRVSAPGEKIKPLAPEECAAFLEAAREERLEALYVLAVHCGLREGELLALCWEDANLEAVKPVPCMYGAPSPARRTGVGTSSARALNLARVGVCASPRGR